MPDYSLVPVDYQPDFDDYSLVPVDYDPFAADGLVQQAQFQQAQAQPQGPPQQPPATGAGQPDAGAPAAPNFLDAPRMSALVIFGEFPQRFSASAAPRSAPRSGNGRAGRSRGMLRLRAPALARRSRRHAAVAAARYRCKSRRAPAVILSAICAMAVPRTTIKAAKIIRLRITPHPIRATIPPRPLPNRDGWRTAKGAILTKRMSEVLTGAPHVPRGFTRRVGIALAGSSGQGCRG